MRLAAGLLGAVLVGMAALGLGPAAHAQATQFRSAPPLLMGVAWYPEQWPESRWDADLSLMQAAGVKVVRVGEFAWSTIEPQEGVYRFEWLDRAIDAAAGHGMVVVLGTPTAAPPAWLTSKYPDVLRVDEDGTRAEHGSRRQFSFASPRYRDFARRIATLMAKRYGHNPHVVGWQIDNEIGPPSFDAEAKRQFHDWLRRKYGDIANLNARWTTAYWSQTYDDFDEIPMHSKLENPGLLLDWKSFVSDTWVGYVRNQAEAIRANADARQFITTNTMGWNAGYDHYDMHRGLDIAAWDDYVPSGEIDWIDNGARHDLVRGYKRKNFWVMETQPVFVDWWPVNASLARGQVRQMAWQAVGHGADAVLYWQWRSALNGQEQYHGNIVGPDGRPQPVYPEIAEIGADFARAAPVIAGTTPHSEVAVLFSYKSRWAIDFQRHNKDFDPVQELVSFYRPLRQQAQSVDIVSADAPLSSYRLVVAPSLNVLTREEAEKLAAYVRAGGHLVLGPRTGMKDDDNALWPQRQPGPLRDVLHGRVEQFYALDAEVPVGGDWGSGQAKIWAEALSADPGTQVLMRYGKSNGWLDGQPAVLTRQVGQGEITYVGAWFDDKLMDAMTADLLRGAGVRPLVPNAPAEVEVNERDGAGRKVLILINQADRPKTVTLPQRMSNVLAGGPPETTVQIGARGVAVLTASPR